MVKIAVLLLGVFFLVSWSTGAQKPVMAQSPGLTAIGSCGRHISGPGTYNWITTAACNRMYYFAFEYTEEAPLKLTVSPLRRITVFHQIHLGIGRDGATTRYEVTRTGSGVYGNTYPMNLHARSYTLRIRTGGNNAVGTVTFGADGRFAAIPSTAAYTPGGFPVTSGLMSIYPNCGRGVNAPGDYSMIFLYRETGCPNYTYYLPFTVVTNNAFEVLTVKLKALNMREDTVSPTTRTMMGFVRSGHGVNGSQIDAGSVSFRIGGAPVIIISSNLPSGDYTLVLLADYRSSLGTIEFTLAGLDRISFVPGRPKSLSVLSADNSATFVWVAPLVTGGQPITGYEYRLDSEMTVDANLNLTATLNNLVLGQVYVFRVWAINVVGPGLPLRVTFAAGEVRVPKFAVNSITPGVGVIVSLAPAGQKTSEHLFTVVDGANYTSQRPTILGTYFRDTVDLVGDSVVNLQLVWSEVDKSTGYEVEREFENVISYHLDKDLDLEWSEAFPAADSVHPRLIRYRVRGILVNNETTPFIFNDEERLVSVPGNAEVYSPWSDVEPVTFQVGGARLTFDRTTVSPESKDLDSDDPALGELVGVVAGVVGLPASSHAPMTIIAMVVLAVGVFILFAMPTGFAPLGLFLGASTAGLTFAVGGPILAGIPWEMAALPAALLMVVGIMTLKARGVMG